jgi:hypothetical protein
LTYMEILTSLLLLSRNWSSARRRNPRWCMPQLTGSAERKLWRNSLPRRRPGLQVCKSDLTAPDPPTGTRSWSLRENMMISQRRSRIVLWIIFRL